MIKIDKPENAVYNYKQTQMRKGGHSMSEYAKRLEPIMKGGSAEGFKTDKDYFYAVGQLVMFMQRRKEGSKITKMSNGVNKFMNAETDEELKKHLVNLFKIANSNIYLEEDNNFNHVLAAAMAWKPEGINPDMIMAGYTGDNVLL